MEQLRADLAGRAEFPVALAYLQDASPDLESALRAARDQGAGEVTVIPAFMSGGGHLLKGVPDQIARAADKVEGLTVTCSGAIAEEPEVAKAMVEACLRLAKA